jgi:hypothetical protein
MATTGSLDVYFIAEAVPPKEKSRWDRKRMEFPRRIQQLPAYIQWAECNANVIQVDTDSFQGKLKRNDFIMAATG